MTQDDTQTTMVPSLLDRLTDAHWERTSEVTLTPIRAVHELIDSIAIDIEKLLNTRPRAMTWPPKLDQLNSSLVDYGLADYSRRDLATDQDRDLLRKQIEDSIARFEPRISDVRVSLLDPSGPADSNVRFQIRGRLAAVPDIIVFEGDSTLCDAMLRFHVKGVN